MLVTPGFTAIVPLQSESILAGSATERPTGNKFANPAFVKMEVLAFVRVMVSRETLFKLMVLGEKSSDAVISLVGVEVGVTVGSGAWAWTIN
jgi:predicted membrane-bound spermidine synthase